LTATGDRIVIGSAADVDLSLHEASASPRHLKVERRRDGFAIRSLNESAAVFVGPIRVYSAVVPIGTRLRVGSEILEIRGAGSTDDLRQRLANDGLVYAGHAMNAVAEAIARVAPFSSSVLIEGETGTGKEVVAQAIHRLSMRNNGPYLVVDCAALAPTVVESELFGHERGAFTGADRRRQGAFERAHGGTLFLDEIGELPLVYQATLLGVLQRRRFRRVGGEVDVVTDVRVIAATNRPLERAVERGSFRQDLYYRLATVGVSLPPLRERREDIRVLVEHFLRELRGTEGADFPDEDLAALERADLKGNVRELRAIVERFVISGQSGLERGRPVEPSGSVPPNGSNGSGARGGAYRSERDRALAAFERSYLRELMTQVNQNASEAARVAKMDRPHLLRMLRKHGLR
jgi:transcriptional regulator with GAF, ATPase, and Fis domain